MNADLHRISALYLELGAAFARMAFADGVMPQRGLAVAALPMPMPSPDTDIIKPVEQQIINAVADAGGGAARRQLAQVTGLGPDALSYHLKRLCARGLLARRGKKAASRYWLPPEQVGRVRKKRVA